MILGYFLFDSGGVLLIQEQFVGLVKADRTPLFASLLTAISKAMEQILKQKPRYLQLENLHIYFGFSDNYIFALISDIEFDEYLNLTERVVKEIEDSKLTPEEVNINVVARETVRRIIRRLVLKRAPALEELVELAKMVTSFSDLIPTKKFGDIKIEVPQPISLEKKKVSAKKGDIRLDDLVENFMNGKLWEVIEEAPKLFDTPSSSLAKALYVKSGIILNLYDPDVKAPSLEELYWAVQGVDDDVLRDALLADLEAFIKIAPQDSAYSVYIKNSGVVDRTIKENTVRGRVYEIVFNPIPWRPFLEYIIMKYENKYDFFVSLAKELLITMNTMFQPPQSIDEWLRAYSDAKLEFERALEKKSALLEHKYYMFLFTVIWGLLVPNLTVDDGFKILQYYIKYIEKHQRVLGEMSKRTMVLHKAQNVFYLYNILVRILFESLSPEDRKEVLGRLEKKMVELSKYLVHLYHKRRVPLYIYLNILTSILAMYTRLKFELKVVPSVVSENILRLLNKELRNLNKTHPYSYIQLYINVLDMLGNMASLIDIETVRLNMLMRVAHLFDSIATYASEIPIIEFIATMHAIRYYAKCKPDKAEKLLESKKNKYSPFLWYILQQVYQINKLEKSD